jgi:hypothetical protein
MTWGSAGGTVSSVAATVPPYMTVTGSPITGSGTLAFDFASESPNLFFASPNGSSGPPGFRAILASDVPVLNQNTTGSAGSLSGIVSLINGGTGVSAGSTAAAFDALSPMTTAGDIIYENSTPAPDRLPIGTTGQVLTVVAGLPAWAPSSGGASTVELFTLTGTDITNGYVTLSTTPVTPNATILLVASGPNQFYGVDFTVSGNQLSWTGLALNGILASGDQLTVIHN